MLLDPSSVRVLGVLPCQQKTVGEVPERHAAVESTCTCTYWSSPAPQEEPLELNSRAPVTPFLWDPRKVSTHRGGMIPATISVDELQLHNSHQSEQSVLPDIGATKTNDRDRQIYPFELQMRCEKGGLGFSLVSPLLPLHGDRLSNTSRIPMLSLYRPSRAVPYQECATRESIRKLAAIDSPSSCNARAHYASSTGGAGVLGSCKRRQGSRPMQAEPCTRAAGQHSVDYCITKRVA